MKQQTCFVIGEGKEVKMFLTKEEAQSAEIAIIVAGLFRDCEIPENEESCEKLSKRMLLQKDTIVAALLGKRKRKPLTPKAASPAASTTDKPTRKKKVIVEQPALV